MKLNRQLGILMYLLSHDKTTARELAERFEVSSRTIRRDMEDLSIAGIPVYASQGTGGGIRLMEGYSLSRVLVTDAEKNLLLSLLSNLTLTEDVGARELLTKLSALFGPKPQDEWLRVDLGGWGPRPADERFSLLRDAIQEHRLVELAYIGTGGRLEHRRVEPMTLLYRGSNWYLWGWCRLRGGFRLFRLSRTASLKPLNETFVRREASLSEAERESEDARMQPAGSILHLRIRSASLSRAYDLFHSDSITVLNSDEIEVKSTWPVDSWVLSALLSFGSDLYVVSPASLRERVQAEAAGILARYT